MTRKTKSIVPAVVAIAIAALFLQAATLLQWVAVPLSDDMPIGDYQYVGILGSRDCVYGYRCIETAADLYRQKSLNGIVLIAVPPGRLVEAGIVPPDTICRNKLEACDTPRQAIATIFCGGHDDCARAKAIRAWLVEHPDAKICLLCGQFRSASLRRELNLTIDPTQITRVSLQELPGPDFDTKRWWISRSGLKGFGFAWLQRIHSWIIGKNHLPQSPLSADEYESRFLQKYSQKQPCE